MSDPVRKFGIAYKPEGVNLREKPSPTARVLKHLPFNTRVFVASRDNGWLFVTTDDGRFGYCVATHIDTDLPEPKGKDSFGFISYAAWEAAKSAVEAAADFALGVAAFIGGMIDGASKRCGTCWRKGLKDLW